MATPPPGPGSVMSPPPPPRSNRVVWWVAGIVGTLAVVLTVVFGVVALSNGDSAVLDAGDDASHGDTTEGDSAEGDTSDSEPPADGVGEGVWEIGTDVEPGAYITDSPADSASPLPCYWARLSDPAGDLSDIISSDNIRPGVRARFEIDETDAAIEFEGECLWVLATADNTVPQGDEITEGTWEVGTEVEPGTYATTVPSDVDECFWARLSDFGGKIDSFIDTGTYSPGDDGEVTIEPGDAGIKFRGACTWVRR